MANRYWVGGTGTWSSTNTTNWSATSGGAGGASVPTSADTPIFDVNSGSGVVTFTNGGVTVGATTIDNGSITLSLGAAFTTSGSITLSTGTFTTNNYNVTATQLSSNNSNTRTINLGSSTVTLSGSSPIVFTNSTGLTFNAGTSTIIISLTAVNFAGGGNTFYNVSFPSNAMTSATIAGANTFNNFTIAGRTSVGLAFIYLSANQTINGTLTLSAGTNATMRTLVQSNTLGTTRTLTCAAFSGTDVDFRDINIAGAAAPVSGTRLGDCKGNSGITFDAPKTVYYAQTSGSWGANAWSNTDGGASNTIYFPLAQDTAVFQTYPNSGVTVTLNAAYNIGTIDMSARTSNTMTLATATQTPAIYGNWINGTGTTLSGTGSLTFAGRGSQTITSAGKAFTQYMTVNSPGGSVTLQDAFTVSSGTNTYGLSLLAGTFDANGYNVTFTGTGSPSGFDSSNTNVRTVAVGSGTWTFSGTSTQWGTSTSTNLTVTGTGTISLTSASSKVFSGGGVSYSGITLNQGGAGALSIVGSNTFKDITNTYSATGATSILFASGSTTILSQFSATGASGKVLTLGATTTSQATLQKSSSWLMGANSTNGGNNTGLSFTAGGGIDYLSVSYIKGTVVAPPAASTGNFFFFF